MDSDYGGYTNGGFAWFDNDRDTATLTWKFPAQFREDNTLRFRYSYPGPNSGELQVLINGKVIDDAVSFSSTGKENKWKRSMLINAFLENGENTIELRSLNGKSAPRIDRLEVIPAVH